MRNTSKHRNIRAFTLVEILIVVVILSILAAIVIPQFSDAAQTTMETSILTNLARTRTQIERYKFQHPMTVLTEANLFSELVSQEYLQQNPRNPLQDPATADAVGDVAGPGVGWVWDGDTIRATDGTGLLFDEDGDGAPG